MYVLMCNASLLRTEKDKNKNYMWKIKD